MSTLEFHSSLKIQRKNCSNFKKDMRFPIISIFTCSIKHYNAIQFYKIHTQEGLNTPSTSQEDISSTFLSLSMLMSLINFHKGFTLQKWYICLNVYIYTVSSPAETDTKQTSGNTIPFLSKTESFFSGKDMFPLQSERILF